MPEEDLEKPSPKVEGVQIITTAFGSSSASVSRAPSVCSSSLPQIHIRFGCAVGIINTVSAPQVLSEASGTVLGLTGPL